MFKKIGKKESLSEEVVKQIEEAIIEGEYSSGDKIPSEKEMCEIFNVSRTVIREAIQKLSARGLIEIRKGNGIYVKDYAEKYVTDSMELFLELNLNKEYIMEVMEVRKLFGPQLAKLAAQNRTEKDLANIEETIEELKECPANDFKKEGEIDKNFHLHIAEACENSIIVIMLKPMYRLMPTIRSLVYKDNLSVKSQALDYHKKIFKKIKDQEPSEAYNLMKDHLKVAEKHSRQLIKESHLDILKSENILSSE